jgi:hypothetical protein
MDAVVNTVLLISVLGLIAGFAVGIIREMSRR